MPSSQRGLIYGEHLLGGLTNLKRRILLEDQTVSHTYNNETAAVLSELICPISACVIFIFTLSICFRCGFVISLSGKTGSEGNGLRQRRKGSRCDCAYEKEKQSRPVNKTAVSYLCCIRRLNQVMARP